MITLKINNKEVTVKKGSSLLRAARAAGIFIPTLCYDERLTPYGSCRLCMVAERRKPEKLIPSCFTPAKEGMDIVTENPEILKSIKKQLQLILINHPLDCPVCDKAGECQLQKFVIRYGITEVPYKLPARSKQVDRVSSLIERDMNRCILCGRCVRICGELQDRHEIDFIHRGIKTVIGTDGMRPLDCDFCGQCVSTCPVGALTDNIFKNTTRVWKLSRRTTICSHCGMGCEIILNTEDGKIRRVVAPVTATGMQNLCARGRFGWKAYQPENRPVSPSIIINGAVKQIDWPAAIAEAAVKLDRIRRQYGPEAIAVLTGDALTTEEFLAYRTFFYDTLGTGNIGSVTAAGYRDVLEQLFHSQGKSCKIGSVSDIESSDVLLVMGGGAAELHPVLKTVINNFLKKEGKELVVISSWPDYCLERATLPILVNPEYYEKFLHEFYEALDGRTLRSPSDIASYGLCTATLVRLISMIQGNKEITLLTVPGLFAQSDISGRLAGIMHSRLKAVIPLGAACNSRGAVMRAGFATSFMKMSSSPEMSLAGAIWNKIEAGVVRALYILSDDPLASMGNPAMVKRLLGKLDLIILQSPYLTPTAEIAHILLPSATLAEKSGTVIDLWGEEHQLQSALALPAGVKTDADILTQLQKAMEKEAAENDGKVFPAAGNTVPSSNDRAGQTEATDYDKTLYPFIMTAAPSVYGDSVISLNSPELSRIKGGLKIVMNADDWQKLNLAEEDILLISSPFGQAAGRVEVSWNVRPGNVVVMHMKGDLAGLSLLGGSSAAVPVNISGAPSAGTGSFLQQGKKGGGG